MEPPMEDYRYFVSITQGNTTMTINALVFELCVADFNFRFTYSYVGEEEEGYAETLEDFTYPLKDDEDGSASRQLCSFLSPEPLYPLKDDEDGSLSREFLSDMMSRLSCKDSTKNMTILRTWKETIYYHLDYAFRQILRVTGSSGIGRGATFTVTFFQNAPMHSLARPGSNLLGRHEGKVDDDCSGSSCFICSEEFEGGCGGDDDLTCMPCSHTFHYRCLAERLPKSPTCPLCRYKMDWKVQDGLI